MKKWIAFVLILLMCWPAYAYASVESELAALWHQIDTLLTGRDDLRALYGVDEKLSQISALDVPKQDMSQIEIGNIEEWEQEQAQVEQQSAEQQQKEPTQDEAVNSEPDGASAQSPSTPSGIPNDLVPLAVSSKGAQVERLQSRLIELGYLEGTADGRYGAMTRDAVAAFRRDHYDGIADIYLQIYLFRISPTGDSASSLVDLKLDDTGENVSRLQRALRERGYDLPVDGGYGEITAGVVEDFKRSLPEGEADQYVQMLIYTTGQSATVSTQAEATVQEETQQTEPADDEPTAEPTQQPEVASSQPRLLSMGDTGDDVRALQQRLKDIGLYEGVVDGIYGAGTAKAIEEFQLDGIEPGVADVETQRRLFESTGN